MHKCETVQATFIVFLYIPNSKGGGKMQDQLHRPFLIPGHPPPHGRHHDRVHEHDRHQWWGKYLLCAPFFTWSVPQWKSWSQRWQRQQPQRRRPSRTTTTTTTMVARAVVREGRATTTTTWTPDLCLANLSGGQVWGRFLDTKLKMILHLKDRIKVTLSSRRKDLCFQGGRAGGTRRWWSWRTGLKSMATLKKTPVTPDTRQTVKMQPLIVNKPP